MENGSDNELPIKVDDVIWAVKSFDPYKAAVLNVNPDKTAMFVYP